MLSRSKATEKQPKSNECKKVVTDYIRGSINIPFKSVLTTFVNPDN